jgi:hypothetical protein
MSDAQSDQEAYAAFHDAVNMSAKELERWLETDESQSVGVTGSGRKDAPGGAESKGHKSGRHIVRLLGTNKADLSPDDYAEMRRVVGYVRRHLAQEPFKEDVQDSRWRASLRNWGHDPVKGR